MPPAGLWLLAPTPATLRFMRTLVHRLLWSQPWQWEQTAWNDVVPHFLVGMGDDPPLRYRLLPHTQFSNLGE